MALKVIKIAMTNPYHVYPDNALFEISGRYKVRVIELFLILMFMQDVGAKINLPELNSGRNQARSVQ